MADEVKKLIMRGVVEACELRVTQSEEKKPYFRVKLKDNPITFFLWKSEALHEGDEIAFEYTETPKNGRMYYTIKDFLDLKSVHISDGELKRIVEESKTPLQAPIDKVKLDNDELNRRALLLNSAFTYGSVHKLEYEAIITLYDKLMEKLKE